MVRSFWWAHLGWVLSAEYDKTNWPAVKDWLPYWELRWLNLFHWVPGLSLATLCWLIAGWSGLVWGFLVSTVLLYHTTFAVNSICHLFGTRRYATADTSRNNWTVALLTLGEGWHNNHHHYQSSANQGFLWWEIDVSYYLIRLLGCTGLVWDIRTPAPHVVATTATRDQNLNGVHGRGPGSGAQSVDTPDSVPGPPAFSSISGEVSEN
jgi:stearoyl-CoA desaturase (delta-9 desaturase)